MQLMQRVVDSCVPFPGIGLSSGLGYPVVNGEGARAC